MKKECLNFVAVWLQLDCNVVPFQFGDIPQAWWNDKNGVRRNYWAGNFDSNTHTCQCGLNSSCILPSLSCNCDAMTPSLLSDSGTSIVFTTVLHLDSIFSILLNFICYCNAMFVCFFKQFSISNSIAAVY